MANIVLLGLETSLKADLSSILTAQQHRVSTAKLTAPIRSDVELVFLAGDDPRSIARLRRLRKSHAKLPIILTTRQPAYSAWLDAIEAGATDYCGAPFERSHLEWILETALRRSFAGVA